MKDDRRQSRIPLFFALSLLVWVLALLYTVRTVSHVRSAASRNAARLASCEQLASDTARLHHHVLAAGRLIELAEAGVDFDLASWLSRDFAELPPPQIEVETGTDGARWSRRVFRVRWSSLPLDAFARIVTAAEEYVPPARLVDVVIDPHVAAGAAEIRATFMTTGSLP